MTTRETTIGAARHGIVFVGDVSGSYGLDLKKALLPHRRINFLRLPRSSSFAGRKKPPLVSATSEASLATVHQ